MQEVEQETVCQMYNLINMYSVPTPPEDLVVFATLQSAMNSLQSIVDEAVAKKATSMEKFCASLQKDITKLNREVMNVKQKSLVQGKTFITYLPTYKYSLGGMFFLLFIAHLSFYF